MGQTGVKIKDRALISTRHREMIAVAQKVFYRKGFHGATMRDIAFAAGMTQGNLYNYVRSKDDILYLVCDSLTTAYHDSVLAADTQTDSPAERLETILRAITEVMQSHQDELLLLYQESHLLKEKSLKKVLGRVSEFIEFLIEVLRQAELAGAIRIDNAGITANILTFLPTMVALRRWELKERGSTQEVVQAVVDFLMRGLAAKTAIDTPDAAAARKRPVKPNDGIESRLEGASRDEVRRWQSSRTADQVRWVAKSRYWSSAFKKKGISLGSLRTARDLGRLPFLTKSGYKSELSRSPPYGGFLCQPQREIERQGAQIFRTTGTTGKQTSIIKSRTDLEAFAICGARNLSIAGVRAGDYVLMTFPYTLWTAAWGFYEGAPRIGATIIPAGAPLPTEMRISLLQEFRPRAIVATPSYALALAEAVRTSGRDPTKMGVGLILVGGEPISTARRRRIEESWGAPRGVRNFSGISEVAGVYLGAECPAQAGMHIYEDFLRADVLTPGKDEEASADQGGELVVTSLVDTALALNFRFRTGDFVHYTDAPCSCGRTSRRILSIESRLDDMRKIRGVNIWASAIEEHLHAVRGVGDEFALIIERKGELDEVTVRVEADPETAAARYRALAAGLEKHLRAELGVRLPVEILPPSSLPRHELKAQRWIDRRQHDH
jgi:phenylacetate-CoA ligase